MVNMSIDRMREMRKKVVVTDRIRMLGIKDTAPVGMTS